MGQNDFEEWLRDLSSQEGVVDYKVEGRFVLLTFDDGHEEEHEYGSQRVYRQDRMEYLWR